MSDAVPISEITVGDRARKNLGDLESLIQSIEEVGLLHPIVVTEDYELIAGERRLEAAKSLGHESIEATVLPMTPEEMLKAERDENAARIDLRRSEMVELGRRIEAVEKERVAKQQREAGRRLAARRHGQDVEEGKTPDSRKGQVRERVGKALGVGGTTYEKAKKVVEAAEEDPEAYGDLVEEMDETGNVTGTHRKLKKRQKGNGDMPDTKPRASSVERRIEQVRELAADGHNAKQIADEIGVSRKYVIRLASENGMTLADHKAGTSFASDPQQVVEGVVRSLEVSADSIDMVGSDLSRFDREDIEYWESSMYESLRPLKRFARKLREAVNGE